MMQKIQRFGGAMMTPVLLFAFVGIVLALTIVGNNPALVGSIANEGTVWNSVLSIIEGGAWTVFNQIEILFVIGLAIGLAKAEKGRAAMTGAMLYFTWNYYINGILTHFGHALNIDITGAVGAGTGLKDIAGIRTIDTSLVGAIAIAAVSVWIHNKFFNKKLPEFLGIFQGSTFVYIIGFFLMMPLAVVTVFVWPNVQAAINSLQGTIASTGVVGVWLYTFLERSLIPTGLHHFIWQPFLLGPAAVDEGIRAAWLANLPTIAQSTEPLRDLFPYGGFALNGMGKVFGSIGISLAIWRTAAPEKRKKVLSILIPVTLTAALTGITEPLEFTFLFVAPVLFALHAFLAATMAAVAFSLGVVGEFSDGLIAWAAQNWLPLAANHWVTYVIQLVIGLSFVAIYFFSFRFLIIKFNFATPGREVQDDVKFYSKKDYKEKAAKAQDAGVATNAFTEKAAAYIDALGGAANIAEVNNCATRLRVSINDSSLMANDATFKEIGAYGIVRKDKAAQVIIGGDVVMIRAQVDELLTMENN